MGRWLLGIAVILSAGIGVVLGALNPQTVTLELAFIRWTASLGAIVALSACAGLVFGFSFAFIVTLFSRGFRRKSPAQPPEARQSLTDA